MPTSIALAEERTARRAAARVRGTALTARGEPFLWALGGGLAFGVLMIVGFLLLVFWNGLATFWPKPIEVVTLHSGERIAGEPARAETFRPPANALAAMPAPARAAIAAAEGFADRTLYRIGNYDLYGDDFRWVADYEAARRDRPAQMFFIERLEWGPFIGTIKSLEAGGRTWQSGSIPAAELAGAHRRARERWAEIRRIERGEIGAVNHTLEQERLKLRRVALDSGDQSPEYRAAAARFERLSLELKARHEALGAQAAALRAEDSKDRVVLADIGGKEKAQPLSSLVRFYAANDLSFADKLGVYFGRWAEFLTTEPREANTEGGVLPAIFGTFAMTLLLVIAVAPFGIITALYLREYAKQGRLVSIVRISVNNLAGVPSIVYGVFGLGFFAYIVGGTIDQVFFPERLPSPTFGTGGLLWASLTLALLTVPVVIVATEEALAAVPRSMREGSLACGASKWQTIRNIVLPRAMPGIMTGLILAMARGAGEVAPLMLVGVVKLAPELPIDGYFPFIHLERSFMHLGFHIYDVGFQSRNSEAGKPMVFVTTMLLIALIALMNLWAIVVRNRLKRKFSIGSNL
ncbi:MAG: phosphate ABC transporter permease PstA [Rhodospirillales bacterium]